MSEGGLRPIPGRVVTRVFRATRVAVLPLSILLLVAATVLLDPESSGARALRLLWIALHLVPFAVTMYALDARRDAARTFATCYRCGHHAPPQHVACCPECGDDRPLEDVPEIGSGPAGCALVLVMLVTIVAPLIAVQWWPATTGTSLSIVAAIASLAASTVAAATMLVIPRAHGVRL